MNMKDYSLLPVFMASTDIARVIDEILDIAAEDGTISSVDVANALLEMIERQINNYKPLEARLVKRIEQWMLVNWTVKSPEFIDVMCTIILIINTDEGIRLLKEAQFAENSEVRAFAEETLAEYRQYTS
jgi:hypothetical protein